MAKHVAIADEKIREVNLIDYAVVLMTWRKILFWIVGVSMVTTVILFFLVLPRWYKSTATIMPPKQRSQFNLSSLIRSVAPLGGLGLTKASDEMYNYIAILKSRSCLEEIVRRFDLVKRYGDKNVQQATKELMDNVDFELAQDDMVLDITAYDTDSLVAAQMANAFVEVLNTQYLALMTREAKSNREFLERRYDQNVADLTRAEEQLRDFEKKYGAFSVPDQVKAAVQAAASLKSQLMMQEVQYGILKRTVGSNDAQLEATRLEMTELDKKLRQMQFGGDTLGSKPSIFPSFEKAPELAMLFIRYFREVEIQQKLMEVLFPLVEQARIEEQRDTPTILVVDRAVPYYKPDKPKRLLILLLVFLSSIIVSGVVVFLLDYVHRINSQVLEGKDEKLSYLASQLHWRKFFYWEKKGTESR